MIFLFIIVHKYYIYIYHVSVYIYHILYTIYIYLYNANKGFNCQNIYSALGRIGCATVGRQFFLIKEKVFEFIRETALRMELKAPIIMINNITILISNNND